MPHRRRPAKYSALLRLRPAGRRVRGVQVGLRPTWSDGLFTGKTYGQIAGLAVWRILNLPGIKRDIGRVLICLGSWHDEIGAEAH